MVEEALPTSGRRARSAVAGKVERKLSWNSVDGAATDDLRTAMESRNIAVGSPVCALLNLIDSSFSTAESALQYMKEASRDRQNVANQPLTADENSFKEQIKKTDGFKRVVPRTRSPTKPHKRSIEDVSTDTNEAQVFHAQYLPRRSRRDAPRSAHPSSSIYTRPTPCSVHRPGISHVISTKSGHRQYNAKNEDEITAGTHTLFKAHTAVRRERSAPARLTDSSSKLITVDKETNADCLATIFPTTRSRKEEGSFSCPQRRLCSSKHISERRRTHKPKRRIQGALVAPKRRAPKHTWRIRKQHLGNIRDGERYCQDYAWKAQKIRRKHERIKTRVGDDTYVHLVSRNIGKKQDTRHHILMAEQGINGAHWLTPNNDQSIAGTKFCQCSPPQTKSISEQSSETSIGSMPRRSLKCLTCDSHKRRHHHSLMKPSSRKSHNSSDPLSRRSVARVTEQCLLSDALPISQHSRKKEECDNIGYEAHSPGISYSSPHILKNEDVRSLQRHSCRERHQLPIPTYCTECGCSYLLAKPCPIRERRSRSGEEFYVQNHMLWDGRSTEDEKNAPGEYHDSGRHPLQRRHECKLGQRCRLGHDYSAHECKTTRLSISPESRWAENTVALNLNKFAKRNEHSHGFGRNGGSMLLRRWPHQHLSVEKMTARTAKPLRIMSARPNSSTLTMLPLTEPPTISTTQSLLEECWELQEMAKPSSNSQSEGYCRCALSQASKLRTVRSGSYNSTSPTYDKDPVMQTSLHSRSILHFKTLKNSCAKCTESAAAEIPHLPRSRPSLIRSRQRLIPTYWRDVRCRSFSEEYITPRSTPPTKTTSETTHMVETVEHCALIRMRSIHSTDVHASSGHLDRMSTTTSSEDVVDKVRPTKHLPKSSHKRLLVPAQPPTFPSSTSPPALYQNPAKIGRVTPWLTKEENSSTSSAFSAASTTALAKRSKSDFHEKRRIRPLEKKQAVLTQNRKMPAKGRNMFPTTLATETKTREDAEPPGNEGKEEAPKEAQKEEPIVNTARLRTPKINLSTAQQMFNLTGKEASPRTGKTTSYRTGRETSTRTARLDNVLTAQQKTPTQASPSAVEWAVNTAYSTSPLTGKEEAPKEAQKEEPIVNTARVRTPKINLSTAQQMSILTGNEASPRTGKTTSYRTGRETSTRTARLENVLTAQQKTPTQASPSAVEWAVNTAYSTSPLTGKEEAPKEAQKEEPIVNTARVRTPKINLSTAQQMSILTGKEASPRTGKTTSYRTGRETSTRTARLDNVLTAQQKTPTQASPSAVEWAVNTAYSTSPLTGKEEAPKEAQKEEPIVNTARVRTPKINLSTAQQMSILTGKEASPRTGKTTSYRTGRETSTRTARPANVLTAQEKPPTPGQLCTTRTRATKTSRFFISVPILCTTNTEDKTKVVLHSISTSALLGKNLMIEKKVTPEVTASHTMNREPIKWNHMEKMNSCATKTEKSRLDSPSAVSARSCTSELITAQGGAPSERTILAAVAASFIKEEVATRRKRPSKMSSRHAAANEEIIERTNCPPSHEKPFTCAPPKQAHTRERRWILRQGRHHAYYMPYDAKVVNGLTPDPEVFTSTVRHAHYPEPSMAQSEGYLLSYSRLTGVTKPGTYVKPASGLFTSGANLQRVGRLQPSNDLRSLNKQVDCQTFNFADATSFVCNRPSPAAANVSASRSRKTTSIDLQKNKSLMQPASSDASTCATEKPSLTAYLKGKRLSSATRVINSSLPWQMHGVGNLNMQQPCPAWITKSDVSSFFTIAYSQAVDKNKRLQSHLHKGLGSSCRRRGKRESRARCGHQPENFTLASKNVNGSIRRHSTLAPSPPTRAAQSSAGGSALKKLISLTPAPCKKLRISQDLGKRSDTIEKSSSFASVSKHKQAGAAQSSSTAVYLRHKRELHDHPESEAKGRQLATIHSSRLSTGQYQKSLHASRRRADDAKYRNQSSKIEKNINSDSVGLQPSSRITGRMSISKMEGALTAERSLKFSDKKKLSSFPFNISQQSFHTTGNSHNETFLKHQQNNASYVLGEAASKRKLSLQTSAKDTWFKGKTSTGRAKNVSLRNFNTDGDNDASRGIKQAWKTIAVNRSKTADDSAAEIASNNEEASISGTDSSRFIRRLNEATGCRSSCELRLSVPASPYSRRTISKENVNVENSESVTVNSKGQTTAVADSFELELNDVVRESVIKGRREIDFQIEEKEAIGMKIFIKQIIADERIVIRRITVNDRELCVTAIE
uniref:C3H1-type domain-containing protein n=1 Tax=Parascaris univalens TaxID=6257 RepID=A0A915BU81_PARUN